MATRLPEAALAVRDGLIAQGFQKALGATVGAMIAELPAGVLAKIGAGPNQALRIQIGAEDEPIRGLL